MKGATFELTTLLMWGDAVLASWLVALRLTLHVLAASVWVGGQITLAGLVPSVRSRAPQALAAVAQQFARIAWPAYVVLLATGAWNVAALNLARTSFAYRAVLAAKVVVVLLAGLATLLHQRSRSAAWMGVWGGVAALASVAALSMGVLLQG